MKNNTRTIIILSLILTAALTGCVSGPKDSNRTFAEKLNGENYQASNSLMGVPILERKPAQRTISGKVFCGEGISQRPVNHGIITLLKEKQTVSSTSTDPDGHYSFSAPIESGSSYTLAVSSSCGKAIKNFPNEIKDENNDQNFYLKK